jgi:hypothetical protein
MNFRRTTPFRQARRYALAISLDASGVTGFSPISESATFAGTFNRLGNTINSAGFVGLALTGVAGLLAS